MSYSVQLMSGDKEHLISSCHRLIIALCRHDRSTNFDETFCKALKDFAQSWLSCIPLL